MMTLTVIPLDERTKFRLVPGGDDRPPNELLLHAFSPERQGRIRHIGLAPKCGTFVPTRTCVETAHGALDAGFLIQSLVTWPALLKQHVHAAGWDISGDTGEIEIYLVSSWHDTVYLAHGTPIATLVFSEMLDVADPTEHPRVIRSGPRPSDP